MNENKIDWALLRKQKRWLVEHATVQNSAADIEILDGIISLLDHLQDTALRDGTATEDEIFGVMRRVSVTIMVTLNPDSGAVSNVMNNMEYTFSHPDIADYTRVDWDLLR